MKSTLKELKEDKENFLSFDTLKIILLGVLFMWFTMALNYIDINDREIDFIHKHWIIRVLILFFLAYIAIDTLKPNKKYKLLIAGILAAMYYVLAEV